MGEDYGEGRYYVAPFELFQRPNDEVISRMKAALGRHPERW
jgi:hypothetical protein